MKSFGIIILLCSVLVGFVVAEEGEEQPPEAQHGLNVFAGNVEGKQNWIEFHTAFR